MERRKKGRKGGKNIKRNNGLLKNKEIILIRHGQTDSTLKGTFCGVTDTSLNEAGINEMKALARLLNKLKDDKQILNPDGLYAIFTSPLKRSLESSGFICALLHKSAVIDKKLMERNFGIFEDLTVDEIKAAFPEEYNNWISDWRGYGIDGGESLEQVEGRIFDFFEEARNISVKSLIIITHSGIIRQMVSYLLGMGEEGIWRFKADTGSYTRILADECGFAFLTHLNVKPVI